MRLKLQRPFLMWTPSRALCHIFICGFILYSQGRILNYMSLKLHKICINPMQR